MDLIRITHENIEKEHICCAISSNKDCQVQSKKAWLTERLDQGLVFLKGDVRGKCFIEYIPAEHAWAPIEAEGYLYIDCLWVSGQFKGHGYSSLLLDECIRDARAQGKRGLAVLSSEKKLGYLSDPKYLKYKGFQTADSASPHFRLMALPFESQAELPRFSPPSETGGGTGSQNRSFPILYQPMSLHRQIRSPPGSHLPRPERPDPDGSHHHHKTGPERALPLHGLQPVLERRICDP